MVCMYDCDKEEYCTWLKPFYDHFLFIFRRRTCYMNLLMTFMDLSSVSVSLGIFEMK